MMTEALGWAGDVSCRVQRSTFRRLAASNSFMQGAAPKVYLSLWNVIALGIGSMVGAGIFALMGQATLMAGKNVYWSFLIGGVAALLSGYTYARLGSRYPGSGGIMDYFNKGFSHKTLAGALTLIYLGTLVITVALVAKSFGAYASRLFLPDESVTVFTTGLFSSIAILLLGALNMGGVKAVGKSEVVLVAFKLLILTILMLASFGSSVPVGADVIPVKGLDGLLGSVGLTFFAFAGYGMMANTAGNLQNPARTLPRAIFLAIGVVMVLYLVLSYVVLTNVSASSLDKHADTAVAQAAFPVLGVWGFVAVSVAALIATASAINATMFSMLDISRGLARNGQLNAMFKQPFWGRGTQGFFYARKRPADHCRICPDVEHSGGILLPDVFQPALPHSADRAVCGRLLYTGNRNPEKDWAQGRLRVESDLKRIWFEEFFLKCSLRENFPFALEKI